MCVLSSTRCPLRPCRPAQPDRPGGQRAAVTVGSDRGPPQGDAGGTGGSRAVVRGEPSRLPGRWIVCFQMQHCSAAAVLPAHSHTACPSCPACPPRRLILRLAGHQQEPGGAGRRDCRAGQQGVARPLPQLQAHIPPADQPGRCAITAAAGSCVLTAAARLPSVVVRTLLLRLLGSIPACRPQMSCFMLTAPSAFRPCLLASFYPTHTVLGHCCRGQQQDAHVCQHLSQR